MSGYVDMFTPFEALGRRAVQEGINELNKIPRHLLGEGNPNHPRYDLHLFGVHHEEFMKQQYKGRSS